MEPDYSRYASVFSWRYASPEMRALFSERENRLRWRKVWVALAKAQHKAGLVSAKEFAQLEKHALDVDVGKAHEIEKRIKHDLMAELKTFAGQAGAAGGRLHLGATSMDIEDNADALRSRKALRMIRQKVARLLQAYRKRVVLHKDVRCMALTHLQTAEPTTVGYRFCNYAQDIVMDLGYLKNLENDVRGKGFKGAVGTSASYEELLKGKNMNAEEMEREAMNDLGLKAFEVSTQVYPRKVDYLVLSALASVAASLHKFALDLRVLQSPYVFEVMEPFAEMQVGSSAMPFKRNPVKAERLCSLARYVGALPPVAWENTANSILERTLDDSANRRIILPEAFMALDEALMVAIGLAEGLRINRKVIEKNFRTYAPFALTEALLMRLVEHGEDRQKMHEHLRSLSLKAWQSVQDGKPNPLEQLAVEDKKITRHIPVKELKKLFAQDHVGLAVHKCAKYAKIMDEVLSKHPVSSKRLEANF
ncbi:adenylosuccinate lyase [Candidatus Micrarchaeota archaeon]|nr:adenylosuccinate lyase [Candidatus Micrarchaeota archaeon]